MRRMSNDALRAGTAGDLDEGPSDVIVRPAASDSFDVEPPYEPERRRPARRPLPRPRAVLAALQRARARAGRGPRPAAARAHPVPRHLRQQPRRVLHGAGGRPEAPPRRRRRRPGRQRHDAARGARGDLARVARADAAARRAVPRPGDAGAGRRGRSQLLRWDRARRRRAEADAGAVHRADLPGADPAGRRPGAPVPLHLRAVAQPRRHDPQPGDGQGALRPGQGAADLPALRRPR